MLFGIASDTVNILIGAGIALFSTFLADWIRRRTERVRIRRGLIVEIESMENILLSVITAEDLDDGIHKMFERVDKRLSTSIYSDNRSNMKSLTRREIEMLVTFYPMVEVFKDELTSTRVSSNPNKGRISNENDSLIERAKTLHKTRDEVLQELEKGPVDRFISRTFFSNTRYQKTNNPTHVSDDNKEQNP